MVVFVSVQKLFNFIANLWDYFMCFSSLFQKLFAYVYILKCFAFLGISSLLLKSLVHFELIFLYGEKCKSCFIHAHVDTQFS